MWSVILMMLAGVLVGFVFKKFKYIGLVGKLISLTVFVMLFVLGVSIGANDDVVGNLGEVGLTALILAIAGIGGSILLSTLVFKVFYKSKLKKD